MSLDSICILRLSAIGDVCNALAAVQAIQRQHPKAKLTWVIGRIEHQLLQGIPGIEFVVFDKSKGRAAFRELRHALAGRRFDVLLHMQVALRANWVAHQIRAHRKIGFDKERSKEFHSLFINERIKPQSRAHVLEGFYAFAEALQVPTDAIENAQWDFHLSDAECALAREQIPDHSPTLVITPAASKTERNWLPERYAALCDYAFSKGFHVMLCGSPAEHERQLGQAIEKASTCQLINLIGHTSLRQLLAILGRADAVVAPDTGPAHMANAMGTPVLGLYAHSNPDRTGPYHSRNYVVSTYSDLLKAQYGKSVEALPWGTRVKGSELMATISQDCAKATLDRMIQDFNLLHA